MNTFHFDPENHEYFIDGEKVPSITQMLDYAGWINDEFYTKESSERGTLVHKLSADFDLGAISDPRTVENIWKGYFLAHVDAMKKMQPEVLAVEQALGHPTLRYGGRPDRVWKLWGAITVTDIKTGVVADWHGIQTALQALLIAPHYHLPPESIQRYGLYLRDNGKWKFIEHKNRHDFGEAHEVIRTCAKVAA